MTDERTQDRAQALQWLVENRASHVSSGHAIAALKAATPDEQGKALLQAIQDQDDYKHPEIVTGLQWTKNPGAVKGIVLGLHHGEVRDLGPVKIVATVMLAEAEYEAFSEVLGFQQGWIDTYETGFKAGYVQAIKIVARNSRTIFFCSMGRAVGFYVALGD